MKQIAETSGKRLAEVRAALAEEDRKDEAEHSGLRIYSLREERSIHAGEEKKTEKKSKKGERNMRRQTSIKTAYVWRKALEMLLMLLLLSVVVFVLARLAPGDPLRAYYGDGLERLESKHSRRRRVKGSGSTISLAVQYLRWAEHALQGDWGISFQYKQPVTAVIGKMWQNTLLLGGISFALTFWLAAAIGKFCALHEGSFADRVICKIGTVSGCIPTFFLALLLILIFAVNLKNPAGRRGV